MAGLRFPFSENNPVVYPGPPPAQADVVVIGCGVVGIMSALYLNRAGLRVVVLEKGRVAAEQSSRNWGWIRAQGRDWAELPFAMQAKRLWAEIAADCDVDIGLRATGVTYLARDDAAMEGYATWQERAAAEGLDCAVLDRAGAAAMVPGAQGAWVGGITTASDMRAEPWVAVPAVARLAVSEGVTIAESCAVRGLDMAAGQVVGVVTEAGRIAAPAVVVAGGAWSRLLLQRHGVRIPQLSVRSTVVATQALPQVFEGQAADRDVAFRRRVDSGYTLASGGRNELFLGRDAVASMRDYLPAVWQEPFGTMFMPAAPAGFPDAWGMRRKWSDDEPSPFERCRVLNPAPSQRRVRRAIAGFARLYPQIGPVRPATVWAGMIDTMPDFVPVVDRVADVPGLVVATGMSGHGFGIAPAFGKVVAGLVAGSEVGDIARFGIDRFGGRLHLGPSL